MEVEEVSEETWFMDAFDWVTSHWAFCAFILATIFEMPHWKLKPFTALFRWIGKHINRPVMEEVTKIDKKVDALKADVDTLKDELDTLKQDVDLNAMDAIRSDVLDFANSCRNGRRHSKEEYNHIMELNDKYEVLRDKHHIKNGIYAADYAFVLRERDRCQSENSFLA